MPSAKPVVELGFPFHRELDAHLLLTELQEFMAKEALDEEFFLSGQATLRLEEKVARFLGKESACWFPTGVMAQAAALKIHCAGNGNSKVLLHPTSHLLLHESNAIALAHGLKPVAVGDWSCVLQGSDIDQDAGCAIVELPQRHNGGALPTWEGLQGIVATSKRRGIPLHMDGARLWSCGPHFEGRSLAEIALGFDSVYVSFYKDIGAIGGAALAGDAQMIAEARTWRARLGGLMPAAWPAICDTLRLLDARIQRMPQYVARAREIATIAKARGLSIVPDLHHVNMFHISISGSASDVEEALRLTASDTGLMLGRRVWDFPDSKGVGLEICVGDKAMGVGNADFEKAFEELAGRLRSHDQ